MTAHMKPTTTAHEAESETVTFAIGRKRFNGLLRELLGNPTGHDWGKPDLVIDQTVVTKMAVFWEEPEWKVDYVEVFSGTPVGPVLVIHGTFPNDSVIVTMRKPTQGIYRTTDRLIAEALADEEAELLALISAALA
ncbi:hypothetical protein NX862_14450 [Rhodobacter sp. KR11]|uniref:hypothetical protein n=1 Tax=Rhodobacter sp. KR11 TaxID=2974588 RepID=UPI00222353B3|nr:hypothetical protein [Rhodobacter sp. KR11]MCW1919958.1 hypothetical protein [Rhodobacter sp. KR11]